MWTPRTLSTTTGKLLVGLNAVVIVACVWCLIVVSYLVGMLKDGGLALAGRILGYGLATLFGIVAFPGLVAILIIKLVYGEWHI
jgi:hypothetical protein